MLTNAQKYNFPQKYIPVKLLNGLQNVNIKALENVKSAMENLEKAYFLPGQGKIREFYKQSWKNGKIEKHCRKVMEVFHIVKPCGISDLPMKKN